MRHIISAIFAYSAVILAAADQIPALMPERPRKIVIGQENTLPMIRNGQTEFVIVLTPDSGKAAQFAAGELAVHLSGIAGSPIPVVDTPPADKAAIIVGSPAIAAAWGINPAEFDRDGFIIRRKGRQILLIGRDTPGRSPLKTTLEPGYKRECATLFAVYDFLERFAGVRFYFPGELGVVTPPKKDWSLPEIDIYDRPDWIQRRFSSGNHSGRPARYPAKITADRKIELIAYHQLRNRRETLLLPCCHGMSCLKLIERFGQSHPEYFCLYPDGSRSNDPHAPGIQGHICYSNAGIKNEIVQDGIAFLQQKPAKERNLKSWHSWWHPVGLPIFDMMPTDGLRLCCCPECSKHFGKDAKAANDYIWDFFIDTANKIKAGGGNGYVSTMAYAQYGNPPEREIPEHLMVMLATRGPWDLDSPEILKHETDRIKLWTGKLGRRTWLWTYPGKYWGMLKGVPHSTPRTIGKYFKLISPHIFGAYIESDSDVFIFNHLNHYIFGKVAWNNDCDIDALLDEYYTLMYGAAAGPMKEFFERIETLWMTRIGGKAVNTPLGPKIVTPSDIELWQDIYSPAEIKKLDRIFDRAEKAVKNGSLEYKRIVFMREEFFGPLKSAASSWHTLTLARDAFCGYPGKKLYLRPTSGRKSEVKTVVTYRVDPEFFYFDFDCEEPYTDDMIISQKGGVWSDSEVELLLDPSGKRTGYFQIMVNAGGFNRQLQYRDGVELPWESNAEISSRITPGKGYKVSIKLPKKSLGEISTDRIPADFCRVRGLKNRKVAELTSFWRPYPGKFGDVANFGTLHLQPAVPALIDFDFSANVISNKYIYGYAAEKTLNLDSEYFIAGGRSLVLVPENRWFSGGVKLEPDSEYTLSYFAKLDNVRPLKTSADCGLLVRIYDGGKKYFRLPPTALHGSADWKYCSYTFKTGKEAGQKKGWLNFSLSQCTGKVWIDCIKLRKIR